LQRCWQIAAGLGSESGRCRLTALRCADSADEESAARKLTFVQAVAQCGNYGDPPSAAVFMPQMLEFVSCVVVGRVTCGLLVWVRAAHSLSP
jgi:hypothetical protein